MKNYLVTGGAGFIGANFVNHLIYKYHDDINILIVDALTYAGNLSSLEAALAHANVKFVKGDIGDTELITRLLADFQPDYIVNFAAESHVDRSITEPGIFVRTNVLGAQNLLECTRRAWLGNDCDCSGKLFLQVSTDEVYGSLPITHAHGVSQAVNSDNEAFYGGRDHITVYGDDFFTEDTPLSPRSPYSASKASADMLALAYNHTYGLPVCITRCSNNYGPMQFPEKLIPLVINNILEGRQIPVYGDGLNVRDWLYVDDHAEAIDTVLRHGQSGEVYNVGGFNEHTNIEIVTTIIDTVAELVASDAKYAALAVGGCDKINHGLIKYVTDRAGHDRRYAINPAKTIAKFGWAPKTRFTEGIKLTVRWYLDNQEWVKSVISGDYREYYNKMYKNR